MSASDLVVPVRQRESHRGLFRWPKQVVLASARSADVLPLGQLAADLKARLGLRVRIERDAFGPAAVRVRPDHTVAHGEGYCLAVSPGGVEIFASADAGAYYALQTLRELLGVYGAAIPACAIDDRPDFPRRGVYLDCSRGKVPTLEALRALVERLAHWKINELQLYVENVFTFKRHPAIGRGYSPFTPQDMLDLQDFCKAHHVRLVPSLASFGHMERILKLPQYAHLGEMPGYRDLPGGTTLCPGDPGSIKLMEELFEEFVPLHEAVDFNVCGDEPWELGKGRSKALADRIGVGRVYLGFLLKLRRLCAKHGKRMNLWGDIVLQHPEIIPQVPKDIVMLNWDYSATGKRIPRTVEITRAHLPAVVCPGTNAWNSHGCRLSMGMGNIAAFAAEGLRRKAEGLLNTDWGDGGHRNMLAISLHNFAYGAAHSWHHAGVADKGFTDRFCRDTFGRLAARLAGPIRTMGGLNEALGQPYSNASAAYRVFLGPLEKHLADQGPTLQAVDAFKDADIRAYVASLAKLRWPAPPEAPDRFLANIFQEFQLSTHMELLACQRMHLLRLMRAGKTPSAGQWKALKQATRQFLPHFRRVWLLNNRPSRLKDNLQALAAAMKQYDKLARR